MLLTEKPKTPDMTETRTKIIAVVGPTASGKTDLARFLASECNGEIVSVDSRQIYKGLDIGTGKEGELRPNTISLSNKYPTLRYLGNIPQWLIDIADPTDTMTAAEFQTAAYEVTNDIASRGKVPVLTGGTGLYVSALIEGYEFSAETARDKQNNRHADKNTYKKSPPNWDVLLLGIDIPREELYTRIDKRLRARIDAGLIDEGKSLLAAGVSLEKLRKFGLEYRFLADVLDGTLNEDLFASRLATAIHQYARRQLTWWRHHGVVHWIKDNEQAKQLVNAFLTTTSAE